MTEYFESVIDRDNLNAKEPETYTIVSHNKKTITLANNECYSTEIIYGAINIDTKKDNSIHCWKLKILQTWSSYKKLQMYSNVWIGINEVGTDKRHEYSDHGDDKYDRGERFKADDYVTLKLDCSNKKNMELSLCRNDEKKKGTVHVIDKGGIYRLSVKLYSPGSSYQGSSSIIPASVELISYSVTKPLKIDNDNEQKEPSKSKKKKSNKVSTTKRKTNDSLQFKKLKEEMKGKDSKITKLEKRIAQMEKENGRLNKENKKLNKKSKSKTVVMEEEQKDVDLKKKLVVLDKEITHFASHFSKEHLNEIYQSCVEKLEVNEEIDNLIKSTTLFNKHLSDIKVYIDQLMSIDARKYESWNIKEMIQWISMLENGRYKKYLDALQTGFANDGIDKGDCLPDIDKKDLRADPFNIQDFKDRRDLVRHFQSLKIIK